jgi:hypothetical protein
VDRRDRVVHAIALNQCMNCGEATMFRHPRSGKDVDRGLEAVAAIEERYSDLRAQGLPLATELSKAVNDRIFVEAKRIANEIDETQNPPQTYRSTSSTCARHAMAECVGRRESTLAPRLPSYRRRGGTSSRLAAGHCRTNRSTKARRITGREASE